MGAGGGGGGGGGGLLSLEKARARTLWGAPVFSIGSI